jgi:hypothetical protein
MSRGFLLHFDFYIHLNINSYSSTGMKAEFYSILILLILITPIRNAAFELTNWNKHGGQMQISTCNKDSLIDFGFTSNTKITCTTGGCSTVYKFYYFRSIHNKAQSDSWMWEEDKNCTICKILTP